MLIHIVAKEFDILGSLTIDALPNNSPGTASRRISKVATLDGGVVVNDSGYSHGDRELRINYKPVSIEHDEIARRLLELHSRVIFSTWEGCFEGAPLSFEPSPRQNTFTLSIIEKLSED